MTASCGSTRGSCGLWGNCGPCNAGGSRGAARLRALGPLQPLQRRRQQEADAQRIPAGFDARAVEGLRSEAGDVIHQFKPATLGQASRLAGVNPADVTVLRVALARARAGASETS